MRKNFIKVLPKEQCLEIAKIVHRNETCDDDELLYYLPDKIFGNEMVFSNLHDDFEVFDGEYAWHVPTYFVECAPVLII